MPCPIIVRNGPLIVHVDAGKTYFWCACGLSKQQPFCDGTHAGSGFGPVAFMPARSGEVGLCGCKLSTKAPHCDGAHKQLREVSHDTMHGIPE
ncbi:MAG: CDGSH iron-sulfur domain-containing protein [Xanthobacteraceae bacterium]|nr:CDGSH iron-sulfur domain-containing protein [Xanthobacteraceae bacterium]